MDNVLQALLARLGGANPAFLGGTQISNAGVAGLNNPQLNAALANHLAGAPAPNGRVAGGFDQFGPSASNGVPTMASPNLPTPMDDAAPAPPPSNTPPPALSAQAMAPVAPPAPTAPMPRGVPTPMARPSDAPAPTPDMGFFARNAAMMRDPSSGAFIDPTAADQAQASGPDVIQKLMSYFHNKGNPDS